MMAAVGRDGRCIVSSLGSVEYSRMTMLNQRNTAHTTTELPPRELPGSGDGQTIDGPA